MSQNHLPPNSVFSLDFGHFILEILENSKILAKNPKIFFKTHDLWGDIPPGISNRGDTYPSSPRGAAHACCGDPDLSHLIWKFRQLAGFSVKRLTCPKAGHGPAHTTDVIWPKARMLPLTVNHPSREQIASPEAAQTRLPHAGWLKSLTLSPLSYMGGLI